MSLSSTNRRNDYTGNGSVSVYAYTFRVVAQADLEVRVKNTTTGAITTLALTTDYTVSGVGSSSGGNVTLVNASQAWLTSGNLSSGYTLTIRRVVSLVQNTDIRNQGSFLPETHENALDFLTMICQQQQDSIDRSVALPDTIPVSTFNPTLPALLASYPGSTFIVNAAGTGFDISGSLTGVPVFYIQDSVPTAPSASQLAFWYNTATDQMAVWCRTEWRVFA